MNRLKGQFVPTISKLFESEINNRMKRKELEQRLSKIKDFKNPKFELEQYMSRATIASDILYSAAYDYDDIEDALVVDLGAGTGALTAASLYVRIIVNATVSICHTTKFDTSY